MNDDDKSPEERIQELLRQLLSGDAGALAGLQGIPGIDPEQLAALSVSLDPNVSLSAAAAQAKFADITIATGDTTATVDVWSNIIEDDYGTATFRLIALADASAREVPYRVVARRPGDIASCYASPDLARDELGWEAEHSIDEACQDSWNWQSKNPNGFQD